jgi:hypothetical protein
MKYPSIFSIFQGTARTGGRRPWGHTLRGMAFAAGLILGCRISPADVILPVTPLLADDSGTAPAPEPAPANPEGVPDYRTPPPGQQPAPQQNVQSPWSYEFSFTAGYSNLEFKDATGVFYNTSGPYFDGNFALPLPNLDSPIVGFGVSVTGHYDNRDFTNVGTLYSDVNLVSFEGRIAAPIPADSDQGLFLLPRLGLGVLFDNYQIERPAGGSNSYTSTHNGFAAEARPSIEAGYRWSPNGSAGIEGSYMYAWGDFGRLGSFAQELRVGLVVSLRY